MKRLFLLLPCFFALSAFAQSEAPLTVSIHCAIARDLPSLLEERWQLSTIEGCPESLFEQVRQALADHNIVLVPEELLSTPSTSEEIRTSAFPVVLELETIIDWDTDSPAVVFFLPDTHLAPSSMLAAHGPDTGIWIAASDADVEQPVTLLAAALILYTLDRCPEARPYFERLLDAHPRLSHFYLGNCAILEGDYAAAVAAFEASHAAQAPDSLPDPAVVGNLAWVYFQSGERDEAFSLLDTLISLIEPQRGQQFRLGTLLRLRAQLHALDLDYAAALDDMDRAIELIPNNPALYTYRGNIRILIYEWSTVLEDYNQAIALDPSYADAYFYRGVLYYTRTDYDLALADFERYLELTPTGQHAALSSQYSEDIRRVMNALGS